MESCGMSIIKYLLFLFNAIFVILGILIIVAAAIDISLVKEYTNMDNVHGMEADILLIVIGLLILVVAAFGCFGAIKESPKLLYLFAGCLILIIIFELSVGIAAAATRPQLVIRVKKEFRESFIQYRSDKKHTLLWDNLQRNLHCCGVTNPDNYNDSNQLLSNLPVSCCPDMEVEGDPNRPAAQVEQQKRGECVTKKMYYMQGCEMKILDTLHGAGLAVIITGIVFCFLEVVGIVLAILLAQAIKNERKTNSEEATA